MAYSQGLEKITGISPFITGIYALLRTISTDFGNLAIDLVKNRTIIKE
jgi:hypothetical protein